MASNASINILGGKPLTNAVAVEICTNVYYRKDELNPTKTEINLCKSIIRQGKLKYKDQYDALVEMALKYNML